MWTALIKGGIGLAALTFMMQVLAWILSPILGVATAGEYASAPSVVRIESYFGVLSLNNLVLLAGLAVGVMLLHHAVVERRRV